MENQIFPGYFHATFGYATFARSAQAYPPGSAKARSFNTSLACDYHQQSG